MSARQWRITSTWLTIHRQCVYIYRGCQARLSQRTESSSACPCDIDIVSMCFKAKIQKAMSAKPLRRRLSCLLPCCTSTCRLDRVLSISSSIMTWSTAELLASDCLLALISRNACVACHICVRHYDAPPAQVLTLNSELKWSKNDRKCLINS